MSARLRVPEVVVPLEGVEQEPVCEVRGKSTGHLDDPVLAPLAAQDDDVAAVEDNVLDLQRTALGSAQPGVEEDGEEGTVRICEPLKHGYLRIRERLDH